MSYIQTLSSIWVNILITGAKDISQSLKLCQIQQAFQHKTDHIHGELKRRDCLHS